MKLVPQLIFPLFGLIISRSFWVGDSMAGDCGGTRQIAYTITVGQSNSQFKTVQEAINSIGSNNARWVKIHIYPGKYTEQVTIPYEKPCIFLEGEGRAVTTITYNGHQQTDTSATFSSIPNNVVAAGINFENSWDLSTASDLDQNTQVNQLIRPALAARVYGDKSAFIDCGFLGFQDTLWDVQGRHYFKNCYIEGAVDFIFGSGQSYYENCYVNASLSTSRAHADLGYMTAQGRGSNEDPSGFVFKGGWVVGSGGRVMLGRAYGPYSRVIFHGTYLDSLVAPLGWDAWNYVGQEQNLMYAEVNCTGPGASLEKRVQWENNLSASQLQQFSLSSFINQDRWLTILPCAA